DASPCNFVVAARVCKVKNELYRRIRKQLLQAGIWLCGPALAEGLQIFCVLIESADELQFGVIPEGLPIKLGNISAADYRNVHAALRGWPRDAHSAEYRSSFLKMAAMSSMSLAVPRKTFWAM